MNRIKLVLLGSVAAMVAGAPPALAQEGGGSYFARNNNISVSERAQASLLTGIPFGSFRFSPTLYAGIGYTTNAFATDGDEEESLSGQVTATGTLSSEWVQHQLSIGGAVTRTEFFDAGDADTYTYSLDANGRVDLARGVAAFGNAGYVSAKEGLTDNPQLGDALLEPVEVETFTVGGGYQAAMGRLQLTAEVNGASNDYKDAPYFNQSTATTSVADQDFRDVDTVSASVRLDTALTPDKSLYISGTASNLDYDSGPFGGPQRDANNYTVSVGSSFDITSLMRGSAGIGAFYRDFDAQSYDDISGLALNADVSWFVSQLLTLNLAAQRSVAESALAQSPAATATAVKFGGDYEFRRNVILSADIGYQNTSFEGLTREDHTWRANAGANYIFRPWASFTFDVGYTTQESSGQFSRDYDQLSAYLGVLLHP